MQGVQASLSYTVRPHVKIKQQKQTNTAYSGQTELPSETRCHKNKQSQTKAPIFTIWRDHSLEEMAWSRPHKKGEPGQAPSTTCRTPCGASFHKRQLKAHLVLLSVSDHRCEKAFWGPPWVTAYKRCFLGALCTKFRVAVSVVWRISSSWEVYSSSKFLLGT